MSEIVDCIGYVVRKTFYTFYILLKFLGKRFLDLLGLIFNVAACCTIVRLPFMVAQFISISSFFEWRLVGFVQLLIFIMDIPIFIMALIVLLTFWRVYPCVSELAEEWDNQWKRSYFYYTGFEIRAVIIRHFFTLFMDVFCVPSALICLMSWRCYIFISKMKKADDDWERRKICFQEFFQVIWDIPLILAFAVVIFSWRLPFLIHSVNKDIHKARRWNRIRYRGIRQFCYLIVDIPCIILFLITMITWRSPILIWELSGTNLMEYRKNSKQWEARLTIFLQFAFIFVDIPCIVASLCILLSVWRLPPAFKGLKKVVKKARTKSGRSFFSSRERFYTKEFRIRRVLITEFGMIFVDVLSFVMAAVVLVTIWRAYPLLKEVRKYYQRFVTSTTKKKRKSSYGTFNEKNNSGETKEGTSLKEESYEVEELETNLNVDADLKLKVDVTKVGIAKSDDQLLPISPHGENEQIHYGDDELPIKTNAKTSDGDDLSGDGKSCGEQDEAKEPSNENSEEGEPSTKNTEEVEIIEPLSEHDSKKPLTWSNCTWKIRKSIAIHFVMLFIDLPAIPLSLFLLVTGLRTTAFLSAVLGSGNFYMMFAITVYYQTFRFFVDLFFVLLFIVLMILRPIQAWVCLLEDEEHMKYRKLCEVILWIPDIAADRKEVYQHLDEIVAIGVKNSTSKIDVLEQISTAFSKHQKRIEKLIEKLKKFEIEDELCYLLQYVMYLENKRCAKLLRKLDLEFNYIRRLNVELHNENLFLWNKEQREFEQAVTEHYDTLLRYRPEKVPLYESKTGLSLRTRKETRRVLIKYLPGGRVLLLLLSIICCIPLYRAPSMIKKLLNRWYDRFNIVVGTLKEYGLDFIAILRIGLVILSMYRAPVLLADIADCVIEKRSWKAVRVIVKRYPADILADFARIVEKIFSWETPRFILTATLFGALMPADLFLTVVKMCVTNKCLSIVFTISIYLLVMGFPFVFSLYGFKEILQYGLGWLNVVLICIFCIVLLAILSLMVMALIKDNKNPILFQVPKCDYVRLSWYNMHVILFEIIEFFQAMALVFKIVSIPMFGSKVFRTASDYLLFSFVPFKVVFWMSVALFIVWFFLCAAPVIFEEILESLPRGTCAERASWRLAISLFANTLFVTIVESFVSFSACRYEKCSLNFTLGQIPANASCIVSQFVEDDSLSCWSSTQKHYAVFGLIALVWYSTTALIFGTKYGDPETSEQDIGFSPIYNTFVNVIKTAMVVAVTIVTNSKYAVVGVLIALNISAMVFTLIFRTLFHHEPCNLPSILVWRIFTFCSCLLAAISVLVASVINDEESKVPLIVLGTGVLIFFIIAVIITVKFRQVSETERDREQFRKEIRSLEDRLTKNDWLFMKWKRERNVWLRLLKSVREASKNDKNVQPEEWRIPEMVQQLPPNIPEVNPDENSIEVGAIKVDVQETNTEGPPPPPPPPSYSQQKKIPRLLPSYGSVPAHVYRLEKNGRNLLLILEKHITYGAYRYAFFSQRTLWLNAVLKSDWAGLLESLRILNSNLQGTYNKPTPLDISLSQPSVDTDKLTEYQGDDDDNPPPVFVKLTKEMIAQTSAECRRRALEDFGRHHFNGSEWCELLDKLLPTKPVIKSWSYVENSSFELATRTPITGTITEVEENGNKLAKGASFSIGKLLRGSLQGNILLFEEGCEPAGKKGPVKVSVKNIEMFRKAGVLYLKLNDKAKVKYSVATASCKTIKWS